MTFPHDIAGVDGPWLEAAIRTTWPEVSVTRFEAATPIMGTATKIPITVDYDDAGREMGLPTSLIVKGSFGGHEFMDVVAPLFVRETRFYRDVAPGLSINTPRAVYAELMEHPPQGVVVLEDITTRGVTFGHMTRPTDADTAALMLDNLAQLHASSWLSERVGPFGTWPDSITLMVTDDPTSESHWSKRSWEASQGLPYASDVPEQLRDFAVLQRALAAMWGANAQEPQTLIHGDAHLGNMFFEADGRPGLLDWQMTMGGPASVDLAEFLVSALDVDLRREHKTALIGHYLDRLGAELGPQGFDVPTFDDVWLAYRRNILYSVLWVAIPEAMQPIEVNAAGAIRASAAANDLDTLGALGI